MAALKWPPVDASAFFAASAAEDRTPANDRCPDGKQELYR
jgi:hypothetical protein